jgi:hypothetical protein
VGPLFPFPINRVLYCTVLVYFKYNETFQIPFQVGNFPYRPIMQMRHVFFRIGPSVDMYPRTTYEYGNHVRICA